MAKIKYEFDYFEDRDIIEIIHRAADMSMVIREIYDKCRTDLKYSPEKHSPHSERILEEIRNKCAEYI